MIRTFLQATCSRFDKRRGGGPRLLRLSLLSTVLLMAPFVGAQAADIPTGNSGLTASWDNTVQYTLGMRTGGQDPQVSGIQNQNDGDLNFKPGHLMENRVDLLSELNIAKGDAGFRGSFDAWYDFVYNQHNDNSSASTFNGFGSHNAFASSTRDLDGRGVRLLDAFIYNKWNVGSVPVTVRLGRLTELWGESLFMADNGIAYGQAPINADKAASVPNTQAKELFLPTGQLAVDAQLNEKFSISAYYQFEWERAILPGVGSYFSGSDTLDEGGQRVLVGANPIPNRPALALFRGRDQYANGGQFGGAVHFNPNDDWDFGFYALRYNDKEPQIYSSAQAPNLATGQVGSYRLVYPKHIELYGVSGSTTYGPVNYAGEVSVRRNEPLTSTQLTVAPGQTANNNNNPLYAVGDSLHYQMSAVYAGPATMFWQGSQLAMEMGGSHLLDITKNAAVFDHSRERTTLGFHGVFTPSYFQVFPGVDMTVPIGLSYNFMGNSSTTQQFNGSGINHGGTLTLGVSAVYHNTWTAGLNFTQFFGHPDDGLVGAPTVPAVITDRDFVTLTVQHTF
jgi:hypothetical protein